MSSNPGTNYNNSIRDISEKTSSGRFKWEIRVSDIGIKYNLLPAIEVLGMQWWLLDDLIKILH